MMNLVFQSDATSIPPADQSIEQVVQRERKRCAEVVMRWGIAGGGAALSDSEIRSLCDLILSGDDFWLP